MLFFMYDQDPGLRAPHIASNFLWIRIPNKYLGKEDKRRLIKHNVFTRDMKMQMGVRIPPPALNRVKDRNGLVNFEIF